MSTNKMKIGEIRDIIHGAKWLRNDLVGGTSEEFRRQQVGPRLREEITALKALEIPARFAADIKDRDDEIRYCENVITRWEAAQTEPEPQSPVHRHVFLGGPTCVTCGEPGVFH